MSIYDQIYYFETSKVDLQLCKPTYKTVSPLSEAYNINCERKLGNVSLLNFNIPLKINIRNKPIKNPNVSLIRERYVVRYKFRNITEYFIIQKVTKNHENDSDYISVECSGMPIQLSGKRIASYSVVSRTASQILRDVLAETTWGLGSIDASFDLMSRSFEFTGNILDAVQSVAETFGALIVWDTIHRKVNFYPLTGYGVNKGFEISYGKLLKSIKYEHDNTDFCTRLYIKGKDDLTINSVNPTGGGFLENYSFFIYPFERDNTGKIIKHSNYMSDDLAGALVNYNNLKNSKENQFGGYITQLNSLNAQLLVKNGEQSDLYASLQTILDSLDVANSKGGDVTAILNQRNAKQALINTKQSEINSIQTQINAVNVNIDSLVNLLSLENNLNPIQLIELDDYVIDGEFSNEFVSDPQQLKTLALENFNSRIEPQILAEINMINLFEAFDFVDSTDLNKFELGDFINIKYEKTNINIIARITEIKHDFESQDIQVTISNITKGKTDEEKFLKQLYTSMGNSNAFAQQKWAYDTAVNKTDEVSQILSETWSAIDREIAGGVNESVSISRRGIIITDSDDPTRMLIAQNGVLGLSKSSGDHWEAALTPDGLIGQKIIGQIIASNNLIITNSSGSFKVDSNGATLTNMNLTLTRSDNKSRTILDPTNGFKIQTSINNGTSWSDKLYADTNGVLTVEDLVTNRLILKNGNDVLIDANSRTIDFSKFTTKLGKISALNIDDLIVGNNVSMGPNATISWSNVIGTPSIPTLPGYITSTRITSTTIESPTITAGTINGTTITGTYINGATINGGNINVSSDITVGSRMTLQQQGLLYAGILFNNEFTRIYSQSGELNLTAFGGVYANNQRIDIPQTAKFA